MWSQIWGVNIIRREANLTGAPPSIHEAFKLVRSVPAGSTICCCCWTSDKQHTGMAVLRTRLPGAESKIPMGICEECMKEPDDNELNRRIIKTLTGRDRKVVDWKDIRKG